MKLKITYRHLDSSPALHKKINRKMTHLAHIIGQTVNAHWVCSVEKNRHKSEASIHFGPYHFYAEDETENMYKSIDHVFDKIFRQVTTKSKKQKDKRHHLPLSNVIITA